VTGLAGADSRSFHWRDMERIYEDSPIHRTMGLTLEVCGPGRVVVHYDGAPSVENRAGHIAGGALAEMIDSAVVQASLTMLGPQAMTATLEMKVNFIRPGHPGALATYAEIDHLGRTTAVGHARSKDESGRVIALGLVTVSIREPARDSADPAERRVSP
jgi:uncharacterized protein (TIGR00369 family)